MITNNINRDIFIKISHIWKLLTGKSFIWQVTFIDFWIFPLYGPLITVYINNVILQYHVISPGSDTRLAKSSHRWHQIAWCCIYCRNHCQSLACFPPVRVYVVSVSAFSYTNHTMGDALNYNHVRQRLTSAFLS